MSTVDRTWLYLNQACQWAVHQGMIKTNPAAEVLLPVARPGHDPATAASLVGDIPAGTARIPVGNYSWAMTGGVYVSGPAEHGLSGEPPDFTDPQVRAVLHYSVDDPPGTRGSYAQEGRRRRPRPSE